MATSHGVLCASKPVYAFALDESPRAYIAETYVMPSAERRTLLDAGTVLFPIGYYASKSALYVIGVEDEPQRIGSTNNRMLLVPIRALEPEVAFWPHLSFGPVKGCDASEQERLHRLAAQAANNLGLRNVAEGVRFSEHIVTNGSTATIEISSDGSVGDTVFLPEGRYVFVLAGNGISRLTLAGPDWNMCGQQLAPEIRETRVITRAHSASGGHQAFAVTGAGCFALGVFRASTPEDAK